MRCVTVVLCCTVLLVQLMMTNSQNAASSRRRSGTSLSSILHRQYRQFQLFYLATEIAQFIEHLSTPAVPENLCLPPRIVQHTFTRAMGTQTSSDLPAVYYQKTQTNNEDYDNSRIPATNQPSPPYPSLISRFIHQFKLCVGFDTVTMFITPEKIGAFYMCHVCEEQLSTANIVSHLSSDHHYFKYLECDQTLNFIKDYKLHISREKHKQRNSAVSKPFYLCHACELNIPVSSVSIHLTSTQHYLNVFAYSKPDLVYLGSQNLDQCAKEEEQNQGKQKMVLQDMAHPGSLKREDSEQVSLIMDLGKQAEKITPNTTLRKVDLNIWKFNKVDKSSFTSALSVLQALCKDEGLGELKPTVVPGARLVSSVKEINPSQCEEQERTPPDTNKINIEEACTDTPINKTNKQSNSEYPDLLHTNHKELSKTSFISSHHVRPDESSLATTHSDSASTQPPISFLHEEQSELRKLDEKSVKQEGFPDQISTNDDPNVKMSHPQTQDSSVPQQQNVELAQKSVKEVEALQKPTQSLACSEAETPAGL
ncbi:hypothetical protein C0J50_18927 [Silurus asotus]|uniref:C2H2-type domain-containing protein n=1 Tax=Silurus asotus TaxID=30991 RepID=A0AAD5ARC9_SILAS|nr:hypothetical protein C0J50_18927 [Silurus asotus]